MGADALLRGLDETQRVAACHPDGPAAVIAGAGTGKTRVLVARVAWLIDSGCVAPEHVCALSFMNDSANEIRARLAHALGERVAAKVTASTAHRLANAIMRTAATSFGRQARYSIWDGADAARALEAHERAHGAPLSATATRALAAMAAHNLESPWQAARAEPDERRREAMLAALAGYEQAKRASSAFDFDDLLLYAAIALSCDEALRARLADRHRVVLLDEAQDTNRAQYRLVALLAAQHRQLMLLGDPDQAICSYRGAAGQENFGAFAADFPERATLALRRNYRSTPQILRAANAVIAHNRDRIGREQIAVRGDGPDVQVVACGDEHEEQQTVITWARSRVRAREAPQDLCVLVRTNELARGFETGLTSAGLPVAILGATGFWERAEVRSALAALRLVANPRDRLAFARAAQAAGAGVGPGASRALFALADVRPQQTLLELGGDADVPRVRPRQRESLARWCGALRDVEQATRRRPGAVAQHVSAALVASGQPARLARQAQGRGAPIVRGRARSRLERLRVLVRHARAYEQRTQRPDLGDFLAQVTLASRQGEGLQDAISVMTVHKAKGLEFPHVWVAGLEEGAFPHGRALKEGQEAEERRLAYVAITRAQQTLHLSWAARRNGRPREPSRYLADLDPNAVTALFGR